MSNTKGVTCGAGSAYPSRAPGLEGIKLCSVLGAQKSCSKCEIQQFDWLILESEYKNHASKFYDRKV